MSEICVTIARRRHNKVLEDMEEAVRAGAQLLEIRLDYLPKLPRLSDFLKNRKVPLIATARRREDGGQWRENEEKRQRLLRSAIAEGFDYIDLEMDIAEKVPPFGKTKRIVSYHNMRTMPDNLDQLHTQMSHRGAQLVKIAAMANHPNDNFAMANLLRKAKIDTVAICMGEIGIPSRILGAKYGMPFSFASSNSLRIVSPGMLTLSEMKDVYFYDKINSETEVYGVIGDPVRQSVGPVVHNASFRQCGFNKVYLPFHVTKDQLSDFIHEASTKLKGLSVTIPHKQPICRLGRASDQLVRTSESANTVVFTSEHHELFNTDGPAAVALVEKAVPADPDTGRRSLANRTVLVMGTGGVARAIACELTKKNAILNIAGRHYDKAVALAQTASCAAIDWNQRHSRHYDVVINCTPVGMTPNVDATPYHPSALQEGMVVFDTVYNPEMTMLIRAAQDRGCIYITGLEMFAMQAEAQFRLFTGQLPPENLIRTLTQEELSPAKKMLREVRLAGESVE